MTREKNICFLNGNRVVVKGPSYGYPRFAIIIGSPWIPLMGDWQKSKKPCCDI